MRARMAYCGPRGIPLSAFLEWSADDQAAALGWLGEERLRCGSCGTADWEWQEQLDAYSAEAYVCLGCQRLGNKQKEQGESAKHLPGLHYRLVRSEGAQRA